MLRKLHLPQFETFFPSAQKTSILDSWAYSAVVYQIYPRSFQDSNGDGVGDFPGIISRLDYLQQLGVTAIWLNPFYPSSHFDMGYDVTEYCDVDPLFGNLNDFDHLVEQAHRKGIKIIIDFVANHTSALHPWFLESRLSKKNPKRDWYIWKEGKADGPPNNWLAVFGGSAWQYDPLTKEYYLHSFLKEQPDLNLRNPEVKRALCDVLDFWLRRGVDGVRLDAANHYIKDAWFRDEPLNPDYVPGTQKPWYRYLHPYMRNRPETLDLLHFFTRFVASYGDTIVIAEANNKLPQMQKYYEAGYEHRLIPFNFNFFSLPWSADAYREFLDEFEKTTYPLSIPNYVLGNHDRPRPVTKFGKEQAKLLAMLSLTMRGQAYIYYGDEIGMEDVAIPKNLIQDTFEKNVPGLNLGRDPQRTPMQWNESTYAGFSTHAPWLPLGTNHLRLNVAKEEKKPTSQLAFYQGLIQFRRMSESIHHGIFQSFPLPENVLAYVRLGETEQLGVVLNFSEKKQVVNLHEMGKTGKLICSTLMTPLHETSLHLDTLTLHPFEGLLFTILS